MLLNVESPVGVVAQQTLLDICIMHDLSSSSHYSHSLRLPCAGTIADEPVCYKPVITQNSSCKHAADCTPVLVSSSLGVSSAAQ
jgi:hypothetical protein